MSLQPPVLDTRGRVGEKLHFLAGKISKHKYIQDSYGLFLLITPDRFIKITVIERNEAALKSSRWPRKPIEEKVSIIGAC